MFTSPLQVELLVRDRQNQYRHEAEQHRLAKLAQAGRERYEALHNLLRWIAAQMIALGCRLQRRYALPSASPIPPTSECATC
jgi:hypothetical protein